MRNIKHRGKKLSGIGWVYGNLVTKLVKNEPEAFICFFGGLTVPKDEITSIPVNPETVEQFIGIYDKNGKEIYEGDILAHEGILQTHYYKVWWNPARFTFYIGNSPIDAYGIKDKCRIDYYVSGNIHDNPELLNMIKQ